MSIREGEDVDEPFFEKDWIGSGKTYDKTNLPAFSDSVGVVLMVFFTLYVPLFPTSISLNIF